MPFFSVIIPTYNRAALLCEAVQSVFGQTFKDYEVIVVDDGSTDETAEVVSRYGKQIRYLQQHNKGPGAARNLGVENASGEYIAFLDSDDLWLPWTLASYYQAILHNTKPAFVSGREVKINRSFDLASIKVEPLTLKSYPDYLSTSHASVWIGTCSVAIKRSIFQEVGAFRAGHINAEDSDLWLRLGASPGFVRIESPAVFGYRSTLGSEVANHESTFQGLLGLLEAEARDSYPGGVTRRRERWRILGRHVRPGSIHLLRAGCFHNAIELYRRSFVIQCRLLRAKYLIGFWMVFLKEITSTSRG